MDKKAKLIKQILDNREAIGAAVQLLLIMLIVTAAVRAELKPDRKKRKRKRIGKGV